MVRITEAELDRKIQRSQGGRRMPYLSATCESMGWPIISEGVSEYTKGLRTNCYTIEDERYLSSLAISNESNLLIVGSAKRQTDGSYHLYFVRDTRQSSTLCVMGPRFELVQVEKMDVPIHSLDWSGSHLLLGSKNGITRLYAIRQQENDDSGDEKLLRLVLIADYYAPPEQLSAVGEYVPGNYPINSIIHSSSFAPHYSSDYLYEQWQPLGSMGSQIEQQRSNPMSTVSTCFLSGFGNHINIWDALVEQRPSLSYKIDDSPMNVASWSPNAPLTLIATAGCDKALKVIDTRVHPSAAVVWRAENAHSRPIRDARFSPFIPYWVATGGEDSLVQVFDLRATHHAPVSRIAGHEGIVRSLTWSNMRPENLISTSSDGTMRMWMLTRDSVALVDAHARTAKWSKKDTPPSSIRPDQKALWQKWLHSSVPAPWSEYNKHQYYGDDDDPWGNSAYGEPDTMMLPSAIGVGEWGRDENLPVFVGEDTETAKGSVCCVLSSKSRLADYYGITDRGQLVVQSLRFEDHENLKYRFRYNKATDPIARQVEYYIYSRNIEDANKELAKLKQLQLDDPEQDRRRHMQVDYFEDCMQIHPPIPAEAWAMDSIPSEAECKRRLWTDEDRWDLAVSVFQQDLEHWSYRLPPGYKTLHGFPLDAKHMIHSTVISDEPAPEKPPYADSAVSPPITADATPSEDRNPPSEKSTPGSLRSSLTHSPSFRSLTSSFRSSPAAAVAAAVGSQGRRSSSTPPTSPQERQGGLHRLATRSKTLRRMFTKRSKSSSSPTAPEPAQRGISEQEENEALPEPPRRQRTIRRNALFGTS